MEITVGPNRMQTYTTVVWEKRKKDGTTKKLVTDFCENVESFRKWCEKHGHIILSVGPSREVEVNDVYF